MYSGGSWWKLYDVACYLKSRSHDFCLKKSTVSPLGFIHFKVSVHATKTTPSPPTFIHYRKMNSRWLGHLPLGFIHYWVNVWSPWGNLILFTCNMWIDVKKSTVSPPMFIHCKKCMKGGGGVQNPWGGWYIYHKITRALINLASYQPAEHGNMTQSNQIYQVFLDFSFVSKTLYLMGKIYSHLNSFEGHLILSNPLIGKTPQKHRSPVL